MSAPVALQAQQRWLPSGVLSLLVHAGFVALLVYTVQWQNHPAAPMQADLWSALPPLAPAGVAAPPPPVAAPEPPAPAPVQVAPPPPPVHAPPPPAPLPTPAKPDIVVGKAAPKPPAPSKPADDSAERDRLAREEAALKKLDRQLRAQASQAAAAQARAEQAEEQRLAQLQRSADAQARAEQQQAQASVLNGAKDRIIAKIKENTIVPASVPAGARVVVRFTVLPDGSVLDGSIHVVNSSGNLTYDDAVQRAIVAAQPLPMPDDIVMRRALRDLRLTVNNLH